VKTDGSGASSDLYEVYAYKGVTIPYSAPAHLALCSQWSGGPAPRSDHFSVIELGCGDGGNLLPLAFYHPDCTFVGIDRSRSALDRAQEVADRLNLENVRLVCGDVRELSPTEFDCVDYVIAHGLYSWVPDDARYAILRFCRDALAPNGLAYISYNAQPGWSTRQIVRDTLRRSQSVREAAVAEKAAKAIEFATRLLEDLPASRFASTMVLGDELARVRDGQPWYVFHEYLTETNCGFWLRDFVEEARQSGLSYVVDAHFCRWEGYVPVELKKAVAKRRLDPIDEAETIDLMGHRYFHASILARPGYSRASVEHDELIAQAYFASSLQPQSETLSLDDGSIVKAAALVLGRVWPSAVRLDTLYQRSLSLLAEHNCVAPSDAFGQLLEAIKILFEAGQTDVRLSQPTYGTDVNGYPTAHALARWEAEVRDALTTPHHFTVRFDGDTMALVRSMDGSRSESELQQTFGEQFVRRTVSVLGRWGLLTAPCSVSCGQSVGSRNAVDGFAPR